MKPSFKQIIYEQLGLLKEQVIENFDNFKEWWMSKKSDNEDPLDIEFDIEGIDFKRSLRNAVDVESPGHMFYILSKLWEMWGIDSDNEQLLNIVKDRHEFGKNLFFTMRKKDFIFDTEAKGAKLAVDRQEADRFKKEYPDIGLNEIKKQIKNLIKNGTKKRNQSKKSS
tara:strand:+ start:180 stop:683 length:504 start_codon:yes stop_codon:yes gene_type:complete